jgi:hypothetical protein
MIIEGIKEKEQSKDSGQYQIWANAWLEGFITDMQKASKSRKIMFGFEDALRVLEDFGSELDKCLCEYTLFRNKPWLFLDNDWVKYVSAYSGGKELDIEYFKYDVEKLQKYYKKIDKNPEDGYKFSEKLFYRGALFVILKLRGVYNRAEMDEVFNVIYLDGREYNPLVNLPSVLRGLLPIAMKEYDIVRAFPTFIDIELGVDREEDPYKLISKKRFNKLLNTHSGVKGTTIKEIRKTFKPVYGDRVKDVITEERFSNRGQLFRDMSKYEDDTIKTFINKNGLGESCVRLHDGVYVEEAVECEHLEFNKIVFKVSRDTHCEPQGYFKKKFYYVNPSSGKIEIRPSDCKSFFEQEKFIRVLEPGEDRITLFKDSNKIVDPFNLQTESLAFLSESIVEFDKSSVEDAIVRNNSDIIKSLFLLSSEELIYYSDIKDNFSIPFKNGFVTCTKGKKSLKNRSYDDDNMEGFFARHMTQEHIFNPTKKHGVFSDFLTMAATGKDPNKETLSKEDNETFLKFCAMIGYMCHQYKDPTQCPAIILSDAGANDIDRRGGRGKTLVTQAITKVRKAILKGGKEFDPSYTHVFADLDKSHDTYIIDDVPKNFNYYALYTSITGGVSCERKGSMAESIDFKDVAKFLITTNWNVRYDASQVSTNRRFLEYKFTDFFNGDNEAKTYFGQTFFEEWDQEQWDEFYSFIFYCVKVFFENGIGKIEYDKKEDNYRAYFSNEVVLGEFENVFKKMIETNKRVKSNEDFSVLDFVSCYKENSPLRHDKLFHQNNTKKMIEAYIKYHDLNYTYNLRNRKWRLGEGE